MAAGTDSKPKILVIEDDPDIVEVLRYNLEQARFRHQTANTGEDGWRMIQSYIPNLIILDLMLPGMDGMEVLRLLRKAGNETPVIILSAKGSEIDRVLGLELGANDYVTKPFSPRELMLRTRKVLERTSHLKVRQSGINEETQTLSHDGLVMDVPGHRVTIDDKLVDLTVKEFRLLVCMMREPGRVFSRDELLERIWRTSDDIGPRTVDTHVLRLREKLGDYAACLDTVRGVGYRFIDQGRSLAR